MPGRPPPLPEAGPLLPAAPPAAPALRLAAVLSVSATAVGALLLARRPAAALAARGYAVRAVPQTHPAVLPSVGAPPQRPSLPIPSAGGHHERILPLGAAADATQVRAQAWQAPVVLAAAAAGLLGWWAAARRAVPRLAPLPPLSAGQPMTPWPMAAITAGAAPKCSRTAPAIADVGKLNVKITVENTAAAQYSGPTLVYFVTEDEAAGLGLPGPQKEEFSGKDGQVTAAYGLPGFAASRVLLIGLGEAKALTARKLRVAAATAVKELKARKLRTAALAFPEPELGIGAPAAGLIASTAILMDYFFDYHISDKERCFHLEQLTLLTTTSPDVVAEHVTVAEGTLITRDLLNTRADIATPEWMANYAVDFCKKFPAIEVRVVDFEEMERRGMNLVRAVGKGAVHKPRIVYMHYKGDPDSEKTLALVGKGLCFDSGGLNLKPTGSIEQMHMDKGGACSVLGAMHAIASQKLKANVIGVVAFAENAIGSQSCKPHEILTSYKGLTVMNKNTDAEGRLVLADAMTYLQREYKVDQMFTVATLTGAILISLGHYAAGMFTDSDATAAALNTAGLPGDERVWRMPTYQEFADQLKGTMCDLHSTGLDRWGGSCTAAAFLRKFTEEGVEYTHLDIAGTAGDMMGSDDRPWLVKGATGWGPNIFYHYVKQNRCA